MGDEIHVCYCVNRGMLQPLCVSAFSVVQSVADQRVVIWVFHEDFCEQDVSKVRDTLAPLRGAELEFRRIDLTRFSGWDGLHGEAITFAKPLLPSFLRDETDRIVYLDADTVVSGGIADLYARDLEGHPIGAVSYETLGETQNRSFFQEAGLDLSKKSFNAGVLLIDVDRWSRGGLTKEVIDFMRANNGKYSGADQAAQNAVFHDDFLPLEIRYNKRASPDTEIGKRQAEDGIIHFVGIPKPWDIWGRWLNENHWIYERYRRRAGVPPHSVLESVRRQGGWRSAKGLASGLRVMVRQAQ